MNSKYYKLLSSLVMMFIVVGNFYFINISTVKAVGIKDPACVAGCAYTQADIVKNGIVSMEAKRSSCEAACKDLVTATTPADAAPATPAASQGYTAPLADPLGLNKAQPIADLAQRLIMTLLGLVGVLALLSFIYGGVLYMLVGVNADNVKKGKEVMKWAVAGLFLIFSAYAILNFLFTTVLGVK